MSHVSFFDFLIFSLTRMNQEVHPPRRRSLFDRVIKYIVDPRRVSHKYLLQGLLCLFLAGPTFFDNFFNACVTDLIARLDITHEKFSLLVSIPSITGVLCGAVAGIVAAYGSTLVAVITAVFSFLGAIVMCYGIGESSYWTIMCGRIVFVMFWNLLGSVQKVIIFRQFSGPSLAWIFGLKIVAIRIGAVSGLYFAGDIMHAVGGYLPDGFWYALILSALSLVCTCAFAYLYRGSSTARQIRPYMIGRRRNNPAVSSDTSFSVLAIPRDTWICCLVIFLYYGGMVPFETFGVDYLVTEFGFLRSESAQAMALIPFFSFFSPLLSPCVSSVRRQILSLIVSQALVAVSLICEIVQLQYAPYLYLSLMGIGHLVVCNAVWLALAGVSPTEQAKTNAASISSAIHALSGFTFNWLTGRVRDMFGNYDAALLMLALLLVIGSLVSLRLFIKGDWKHIIFSNENLSAESSLLCNSASPVIPFIVDDRHFDAQRLSDSKIEAI